MDYVYNKIKKQKIMAKYRINYNTIPHGAISWGHTGKDMAYCEQGVPVKLDWQPSAGWGLQEAHYTDRDGNVVDIPLHRAEFIMPSSDITIGGTFKRFVLEDWTSDNEVTSGPLVSIGAFDASELPTLDGDDAVGTIAFVKDTRKYATWDGYGWTYFDGKPVTPRYLTFTANDDGVSLAFFFNRSSAGEEQQNPNITFQKSTDGGLTWEEHTIGVYDPDEGDTDDLDVITLDKGESVLFKGVNSENFTVGDPEGDEGVCVGFYLDGSAAASGDITSLVNGVGGDAIVQFMQFYTMFQNCTGLTTAPVLSATTLANSCYNSMFKGCTGLTTAPVLPATTLANNCYQSMFQGCTHITSHHVATMNNNANVFQDNSACETFTIDDDTPPTIGSNTITGLKAGCIIYVPAASVDAYKAKQYWSARASYIQAKP